MAERPRRRNNPPRGNTSRKKNRPSPRASRPVKAEPVEPDQAQGGGARRHEQIAASRKKKRLIKLLLVPVLLIVGGIGYNHWQRTGGDLDKLTDLDELNKSTRLLGQNTAEAIQEFDATEFLARMKEKLVDLEDYFSKNPDAQPIETREELEKALAEPDPVTQEPTPVVKEAPAPSPRKTARREARKKYDEARKILRTWQSGDNEKLHQATKHLDEALKLALQAEDSRLVRDINEIRYFCLKSHTLR